MGISVGILGISGTGKSTCLAINPDGTYAPKKLPDGQWDMSEYKGMDPETTLWINCDKKPPSFPRPIFPVGKSQILTSDSDVVLAILEKVHKGEKIKSVVIDTVNAIMNDKEMLEFKKATYDKWMDLARDIYTLISFVNHEMRPDVIVYFVGHVTLYTDVDGNESKCLLTNGRKLERIKLESKMTNVLFTTVDRGSDGEHKYYFETQANRSTGKTALLMFNDFRIPNSLSLVDKTMREYYNIK